MKTCILIPSFNVEKTIGQLIEEIKGENIDVIVVDDGSKDNTCQIAREKGICVLIHEKNKGKGESLRSGFSYILQRDYDCIIIMDGDGQHSPNDIHKFLEEVSKKDVGIVVGDRMNNTKNMPKIRRLTNIAMSFIVSIIAKQKIPDSQCGYRLIKRNVLESIVLSTSRYEIESELLIKASKKGFFICSIPIETIYQNQFSQIKPIADTFRFIKFIFIYVLKEICSKGKLLKKCREKKF